MNSIELEDRYGAHNYHPIPVVLSRGEGVFVYETDMHQNEESQVREGCDIIRHAMDQAFSSH